MAEYIAAADHTKYIEAVMSYLNGMSNLQSEAPEIYEVSKRGYFTMKQSFWEFNAIWIDMALECSQNCDAEGRSGQAGLKEITMNNNAQTRWFKTLPFSAAISTSIRVMAHMHTQDKLHYDGRSATKNRQCSSRDHIMSAIESDQIINPFLYDKKHIVLKADGSVAIEQISDDLFELKHGKKALAEFMSTSKVKKINLHTFKAITQCKRPIKQKRKANNLVNETVYLKRMVMQLD